MDTELCIIIPAYNEESSIASVLNDLCNEPLLEKSEIIVIDDGSNDKTSECVAAYSKVRLLRHRINKGYGSAIITGMNATSRNYVIWFDADGQHRVKDLILVAKTLIDKRLDFCIGVRDSKSHQKTSRKIGKWILKNTVDLIAGQHVKDFNSGLRGFKREVIKRYLHVIPKRYGASTTTTLLMLERGYLGEEVPITTLKRVGESSVKQISDGLKTIMLILRIFLLFKPIHFFGTVGAIAFLLGSIYGFIEAIVYRLGVPVLAAILIIFGVQSFFFGLVCDQITSMRREKFE